jgi:alpha-L-fucosidase
MALDSFEDARVATPLLKQLAWQELELGVLFHFDLHVYMPGGHEHERSRRVRINPDRYNPVALDTDQWLEAAKAMGARYAVFTATHHQGFLQWQSDAYPFGVKQAPWRGGKGDVVADFVESCRKYDIRPGVYIGLRFNAHYQVYDYLLNGGKGGSPEEQAAYRRTCERMVTELCTRYGDWVEVWFDGGLPARSEGGPDAIGIVEEHQPQALFYHSPELAEHRWAGNELGEAQYPCWATLPSHVAQSRVHRQRESAKQALVHGDPDGSVWCPAMADAPLRNHDWCWVPGSAHKLRTVHELARMYNRSVGHNANLILGAAVNPDGLLDDPDVELMGSLGRELERRFARPLAEAAGEGTLLEIPVPGRHVDQVVIAEDVARGERCRSYVVEGKVERDQWWPLAQGTCIGHKRIHTFDATTVAALRLRITDCVGTPSIRRFAASHVGH